VTVEDHVALPHGTPVADEKADREGSGKGRDDDGCSHILRNSYLLPSSQKTLVMSDNCCVALDKSFAEFDTVMLLE
jgi:hypothetical protein